MNLVSLLGVPCVLCCLLCARKVARKTRLLRVPGLCLSSRLAELPSLLVSYWCCAVLCWLLFVQEASAARARLVCLRSRLAELRGLNADRQQRATELQERFAETEVRTQACLAPLHQTTGSAVHVFPVTVGLCGISCIRLPTVCTGDLRLLSLRAG